MSDYRGLADSSRVRLLGAVQLRPGSTLKELATHVGLHVNTARDHLRALEQEGFVASRRLSTGARGRPPLVYAPVVDVKANQAARRRVEDARRRGDELRRRLSASRADPLGVEARRQLDTLYEHLVDTGLEPRVHDARLEVDLTPCPYFGYVQEDRELACAVHAAILRDILSQVPGPLQLKDLQPFVSPQLCRVGLLAEPITP